MKILLVLCGFLVFGCPEPGYYATFQVAPTHASCSVAQRDLDSRPQPLTGAPAVRGDLWRLRAMLNDVTGKNAFLDYAFYGCYCGCGGKGEPLDDNDRCCWAHDCCYDKLEGKCESKLQKYSYTYNAGVVTCTDSNFCKFESCTCDKLLAECLREHTSSFNPSYKGFSRSKCKEKNLPCQA